MPAAEEPVRLGRKRALPACPNPLFLQWLTELRDQAKEKGQKAQHTYQKAINSLNKYPLPLQTAKEAKILQNFGDGICKMLDERLQRYYRENGPNASIHFLPNAAPPPGKSGNSSLAPRRKSKIPQGEGKAKGEQKKGRKQREYVPQKRSGGHAVLLALYRRSQIIGDKGFMFKMELQTQAQPLCDKSFTVPELGSKYTAWSTVSTLIQKSLLLKTHNPARYCLTEEGVALAARLEPPEQRGAGEGEGARGRRGERDTEEEEESGSKGEVEEEVEYEGDAPGVVDLTLDEEEQEEERVRPAACLAQARREPAGQSDPGKAQASSTASARPDAGRLLPGSYEIVLCVDFIETTGGSGHRKQELATELESNNVTFDIRKLNVGDFLWVAREKVQPIPGRAPSGRELVLDYIVERKRMDDLCGSIIDGRFREQKFRLKRCGLKKPIYLVEECGTAASRLSIPESTLQQAIVNTQVVDGFFVKRVQDVKESAGYLTVMTRHLARLYQNCTLVCRSRELEGDGGAVEERGGGVSCSLMSFSEFNHGALKNKSQTVRELFARQLMQISGLSGDKAAAILELYSTPCSLFSAYDRCSSETEKEKLLSAIKCGKFQRNLGPALSRTVYQLYCTRGALS